MLYCCPKCKQYTLQWDLRCKKFLCLVCSCLAFFEAPVYTRFDRSGHPCNLGRFSLADGYFLSVQKNINFDMEGDIDE